MKKKLLLVSLCAIVAFGFAACGETVDADKEVEAITFTQDSVGSTIYDADGVKITVEEFYTGEVWGDGGGTCYGVNIYIENNNTEENGNIWYEIEDSEVNGFDLYNDCGLSVEAGHRSDSDFDFSIYDADVNKIGEWDELKCTFVLSFGEIEDDGDIQYLNEDHSVTIPLIFKRSCWE